MDQIYLKGTNCLDARGDVTRILAHLCEGQEGAEKELVDLLYEQLHALAEHHMRRQNPGHTLQATALVHEAYLKIGGDKDEQWANRIHYLRAASRAMRCVLVDHERRRQAKKRGGELKREPLLSTACFAEASEPNLIDLDKALTRLTELDPQTGRVVELRFFGGLSVEETGHALKVSPSTVKREWRMARAWLKNELKTGETA